MSSGTRLLQEVEISLLLEGLYRVYGYDFRNYSHAFLKKRIKTFCQIENISTISALQDRVLHNEETLHEFVETLTLSSVSMFREPEFYQALRNEVLPLMADMPLIRIWQAACSTGQEAYSLAILLEEEGLYDRCRIYATDSNDSSLKRARQGFLPMSAMRQYTENYVNAGGKHAFSQYYTANYDSAKLTPTLQRNIIFGKHHLAQDGFFNEFHLVLLRNVLVNYNEHLREHVLGLVHESMSSSGILALGQWETLKATGIEKSYKELDASQKLYRRYCA